MGMGHIIRRPINLNLTRIRERFIKINNIYALDDFQQQLVTRIPPNEKLDTPFGYNHLSIMQYSSYSQGSTDRPSTLGRSLEVALDP